MADFASEWAMHTWAMLVDSAPWLLFGFLFAGVIHVLVPVQKATRRLGHGAAGVIRASLLGIPLPLCSCSVIPVASEIRKAGAGRGAFVSFLISTPETGVDSIAISYALLGPLFAVVRPVAALASAVVAGVLTNKFSISDHTGVEVAEASSPSGCGDSCACGDAPEAPRRGKTVTALRYGLIDMFVDLSPWLVAGFVLAGLFSTVIPEGFFGEYVGGGLSAMLAMLVVGLPLYVCATSSTPIAAALIAQGLSPGAALVFLLVGPATNIATMLVVVKDAGRRALAIYLVTIAVVSVTFGLALDRAAVAMPELMPMRADCADAQVRTVGTAAALVLLALLANGFRVRITTVLRTRQGAGPNAV